MKRDEGFLFPRENRIRLSAAGYRKLCNMIDERDGKRCIICGSHSGLHHHHVRFRSAYGSDTADNLVLLCFKCHDIYAHGKKERIFASEFSEYLNSEKCRKWNDTHREELDLIYSKYGGKNAKY